jgi:hypothetical protein
MTTLPKHNLLLNISQTLSTVIQDEFPKHPYSYGISCENIEKILSQYLAMSQAFPYLQAGSQKNLILNIIDNNIDIRSNIELTSVVGNFLCWDETGGHYIVQKNGNSGLPEILNTDKTFHSNMLKFDIHTLLQKHILPNYSKTTSDYLLNLLNNLEENNDIKRCACMVAFEIHAGIMIEELWLNLVKLFNIDKNDLLYFKTHVGGDDPAEAYHIQMTQNMISKIISVETYDIFIEAFKKNYKLNFDWCASTKEVNHDSSN